MDGRLPDGCPPTGSEPPSGSYYRLGRQSAQPGSSLPPEDWALPLDTKTSAAYQRFDSCGAYAYSVFADVNDLLRARESVPWTRKKSIVRVDLDPEMGLTLQTPSTIGETHHDWWPTDGDVPPPNEVIEGKAA